VYSPTLQTHLQHLKLTLEVLRGNQLFAKRSKCIFACSEIDYLGHIISAKGVKADGKKLSAMVEWPRPKSLKALRGFLGLTMYYRKFIKGYGSIATLLTDLLKKNAFLWSEVTEQAFRISRWLSLIHQCWFYLISINPLALSVMHLEGELGQY
jgi:hypothetical protein